MAQKVCSRGHTFNRSSSCPVCPKCWPGQYKAAAMDSAFDKIGAPAQRALVQNKIRKLEQLARHTEREVLLWHGIGPKAIGLLKAALKQRGISFKRE